MFRFGLYLTGCFLLALGASIACGQGDVAVKFSDSKPAQLAWSSFQKSLADAKGQFSKAIETAKIQHGDSAVNANTKFIWDLSKVEKLRTSRGDLDAVIIVKKAISNLKGVKNSP